MSPFAALCPEHGAFESRLIAGSSNSNVTMRGNSEPCPQCGWRSRTVEGTFDQDAAGHVTAVTAPAWSRAALNSVQEKLRRMEEVLLDANVSDVLATDTVAAAVSDMASEAPTVAGLLVRFVAKKSRRRALVAVTVISGLMTFVSGIPDFAEGVEYIVESSDRAVQWAIDAAEAGRPVDIEDYPLRPAPVPPPR
jgi:hypothetical protein